MEESASPPLRQEGAQRARLRWQGLFYLSNFKISSFAQILQSLLSLCANHHLSLSFKRRECAFSLRQPPPQSVSQPYPAAKMSDKGKGKRKLSPEEEEEERRANKRRAQLTCEGLHLQPHNQQHRHYDPVYNGPTPTTYDCDLSQTLQTLNTEDISEIFQQLFDFIGYVRIVQISELRRSLANYQDSTYICQAVIGHYVDCCLYYVCGRCGLDVRRCNGRFTCPKCGPTEDTHQTCTVRVHIFDGSGAATVNLLPKDIEFLLSMKYSSFVDYVINEIDVEDLFAHVQGEQLMFKISVHARLKVPSLVVSKILRSI